MWTIVVVVWFFALVLAWALMAGAHILNQRERCVRRYPVRPMTAENTFFLQRVKAAWRVLTGASDAIEWDYPTERKTHNATSHRPLSGGPVE